MHEMVHSAQYVKMWVEVFSEVCVLFQTNRTTEMPRDNPSYFIGSVKVSHIVREREKGDFLPI